MKRVYFMKILLLWLSLGSLAFANLEVMISHNNKLISVTKKEVSDLYLGKIKSIKGISVTPIDNKDSYKEFYKKVANKTPKQLKAYWIREMYKGDRIPPKKLSTAKINALPNKRGKVISYSNGSIQGKLILTIR